MATEVEFYAYIPEPSTAVLLIVGLACMLGCVRRR